MRCSELIDLAEASIADALSRDALGLDSPDDHSGPARSRAVLRGVHVQWVVSSVETVDDVDGTRATRVWYEIDVASARAATAGGFEAVPGREMLIRTLRAALDSLIEADWRDVGVGSATGERYEPTSGMPRVITIDAAFDAENST